MSQKAESEEKMQIPLSLFHLEFYFFFFPNSITHEQGMVKSSGQDDQYPFGWRVFSAWDFLITERETADNKLASLTTAIKVGTTIDY